MISDKSVSSFIIVDIMGALVEMYKIADVVFVGGSLVDKGGQNIIEPASLGKPVIFGPHAGSYRTSPLHAVGNRH